MKTKYNPHRLLKPSFYLPMASLLLLCICFFMTQTAQFKAYLLEKLSSKIQESGWSIEAGAIHGIFPFYLQTNNLVIRDQQGNRRFTSAQVTGTLAPHHLFTGKLRIYLSLYPSDEKADRTVITISKRLYSNEGASFIVEEKGLGVIKTTYHLPEELALSTSIEPINSDFTSFNLMMRCCWKPSGDNIILQGICQCDKGQLDCEKMQLTIDLASRGVMEKVSADLDFHMDDENLTLQLASQRVCFDPLVLTDGKAAFSFHKQQHQGTLIASCYLNQEPLKMSSLIHINEDAQITVDEIRLTIPQGSIEGNIALDTANSLVEMDWTATGNPCPLGMKQAHQDTVALLTTHAFIDFSHLPSEWNATITSEGEIAPILKLLLDDDTNAISGLAVLSAKITAKENHFDISSTIHAHNASYELLSTGAVFKEIEATFEGDKDRLTLKELRGTDGKNGNIAAQGWIDWNLEKNFPFELAISIEQATALHRDYAHGKATGTLRLAGDFNEGLLDGYLEINEALITLPEQSPATLTKIDVTYINQPNDESLPKHLVASSKEWPLHLDLHIHMPKKTFVNGKNLTSEWHGDIHVAGTANNPLLYGAAEAIHGEYSVNGKAFVNHKSSITFAGDPAHKTTLYMTAMTEIDERRIEAVFKGPISDPKLTFHSNPPMSEKEILSWLLFNKGLREITPFEGAELTESIVTLSGGNGGEDLLSSLRRSIGIDRLEISSSDTATSSTMSLRVGKYLWKGLFVSLNKGLNSDINQVSIEAHLTKRLKLQAEISDDVEGKLHLKWKKDY